MSGDLSRPYELDEVFVSCGLIVVYFRKVSSRRGLAAIRSTSVQRGFAP